MLNNTGAVQALLTIGRVATRTILNNVHNSCCTAEADPCSAAAFDPNQQRRSNANSGRRLVPRVDYSTAAAAVAPTAEAAAAANNTEQRSARFVSACCGFSKDMRFGPSTNLETNIFGDDACFIAHHRTADVVGVADGVGGWRQYGIDPSVFSRSLMQKCRELVESGRFKPHQPAKLLAAAFAQMARTRLELRAEEQQQNSSPSSEPLIGSSTACIVMLDRMDSQLHMANLGDSGFLVVRSGKVVHRSEEQCHYFNAPYQLALPPSVDPANNGFLSDSPESAEVSSFVVKDGDMVLVATDGLFDNLPTELIEAELSQAPTGADACGRLQELVNSVALAARRLAFDREHVSPFAAKARAHGYDDAVGGKPDDITVVLVLVTTCAHVIRQQHPDDDDDL